MKSTVTVPTDGLYSDYLRTGFAVTVPTDGLYCECTYELALE